jgi:CHAT domain-containing protein
MNEQRQQAYLDLIKRLLNCPSGEESEILQANQDLLHAEFLLMLEAVAKFMSQKGDENAANWLRNLAIQLREALNLTPQHASGQAERRDNFLHATSREELQAYLQFLGEVLQATAESRGDARVIYPLLAKNTEYLNHNLAEVLRRWATNKLAEVETDVAQFIAVNIHDFSNLIGQFPLGDKASNMEIAIAGYEAVLTVFTRQAFPQDWAMTHNNLGNAYRNRIFGEKAQNLESAITSYSAALEVYTRQAFPQEWATTQNNLGAAYFDRIFGEKAQNLELAITSFTAALEVCTRQAFPQDWAATQNNLGAAYFDRIFGEKAQNLELAITSFTAALEVRTRQAFPQDWAATQNNLGSAYSDRILGEKAQNLELAIASFTAALEVYTRQAFPQEWAATQNNLGSAYSDRILGEKAQNLESAITSYSAALEVYTRQAFPQQWATTQNNLGNAYRNRILGEKAQNLELAITSFTAALEVYTRQAFPQDWAMTQNNLGNAYSERILGEKAQNLESAIASFTAALEVRTRDAFPQDWAATQNNLGAAYSNRILGKKAQNLELAIASFNAALEVRTRQAFPQQWATTQNNLGNAYSDRILGEKAQNLELAITSFTAALEVYTSQAFPQDWAMTQNNLGNAYSDRIFGEKAQNLESAIAFYTAALSVRTKDTLPQQWATTQNNLGNAYRNRIKGDKAENLEMAIASSSAALSVYTKDAFPQNHAKTLFNLGIAYQDAQQFIDAYTTFKSAIETAELLRGEIVSGHETKRKQAEEWNELHRRMVEVCLELKKSTEAIEYIERSKTRNLVELILERDLNTIFPPEVANELEQLRDQIASGQNQLQNHKAENPTALAQHLQQLRQQRNDLQNRYLRVGYGFKFDQFQATLDDQTAIIEWYITNAGFETFIITRDSLQRLNISNQADDTNALRNWVIEYIEAYYQTKTEWKNSLASRLCHLAGILHLEDILKLVPETCSRLILIPYTVLHQFPLHALPLAKGDFFCDIFPDGVSYAPSCQLLQQVQLRQRPDFQSLFAIQNPTKDLYQDYEWDVGAVAAIKKQFAYSEILKQVNAKKSEVLRPEKLRAANCIFFFCHGYFNFDSALDSGLQLADGNLTLAEIIANFDLDNCRLVTLSACETGLTDFNNTSDEYIGLPYGFLLAGSTNVVSSLWTVSATATALLMIKFYGELQQQSNIAVALNTAQRWLRDTTVQGFRDWLSNSQLSEEWQDELDGYFEQIEEEQGAATKYFESPYYWSAFCAIGKGV